MTAERQAEDRRYAAIKAAGKKKPETVGEARTWQKTLTRYRADGLCHRCASQAAWGHQNGFSLIRPPCDECAPIVATFPMPAGKDSPWRRHPRGAWRPAPSAGEGVPRPDGVDHITDTGGAT